jgi:hypothetical protein
VTIRAELTPFAGCPGETDGGARCGGPGRATLLGDAKICVTQHRCSVETRRELLSN